MKIGFFSDSYKPYMSGVVKSIESFTGELRKRGHEVYIFAPDYPGVENEDYIFRYKSIPALTNPGFRLPIPISPAVFSEAKEIGLDIIHTHSPFLMGWLGRITASRLDIPLVFTYHTLYDKYAHYAPFARGLARKLAIKYSRNYCQACDLVITPSDYVKRMLSGYNITTPLITIPTGINLKPYQDGTDFPLREKYNLPENEKVLLFVGRLGKEKNVEFLIEAFREINSYLNGVSLIMVGDGPLRAKLEAQIEDYHLEDKIKLAGWQPPEKVVDYYLAADLFVFPSVTETQGLVTLEAMAGGLPVVAVNEAGSTVMVDSGLNGLLVKEDTHIFAQNVIELITHERQYHLFRKNAVKKAESCSIQNMTQRLLDSYQGLIADQAGYNKYLA